jgi:mannose-6-phosphate isomerase-like protein (cupin superfamily)
MNEIDNSSLNPGGTRSGGVVRIARARDAPDTLAPDGSEIRLVLGADQMAVRSSLCEVTLPAGQVTRPVWHRQVEECWYILAGHGDVWRCPPDCSIEECPPVSVKPGDALVIPAGWRFQFRAAPTVALRFLCFTSPPWPGPDEAIPADNGGLGEPTV